jgi:hypothetical protein
MSPPVRQMQVNRESDEGSSKQGRVDISEAEGFGKGFQLCLH